MGMIPGVAGGDISVAQHGEARLMQTDHNTMVFTRNSTLLAVARPLLEHIHYQDGEIARRDVVIEELHERVAILEEGMAAEHDLRMQAEEDREKYHRETMRQEGLRPFCRGCKANTDLN
jgi:hypothetical protein